MKITHIKKLLLVALVCLTSCSANGPSVEAYKDETPKLSLRKFFDGNLEAYGIATDWRGKVTSRMEIKMKASWKGDNGTLEESFIFNNGKKLKRVWHITDLGDGKFKATASDVKGKADGKEVGSAANFLYRISLPYGDGFVDVDADDKMYLATSTSLINKVSLRKFGFEVGEFIFAIKKK